MQGGNRGDSAPRSPGRLFAGYRPFQSGHESRAGPIGPPGIKSLTWLEWRVSWVLLRYRLRVFEPTFQRVDGG